MKKLLLILLIASLNITNAQFNGDWYTFRINDMLHYSINDNKIIIKRIGITIHQNNMWEKKIVIP